jgi:hypothetical protein
VSIFDRDEQYLYAIQDDPSLEGPIMTDLDRDPSYVYTIQGDSMYYSTGRLANGLQVLAILHLPSVITVEFNSDGDLVSAGETALPDFSRALFKEYTVGEACEKGADRGIVIHLEEKGFVSQPIKVRRFFLPQWHIGIKSFPDGPMRDALENPSAFSADDQAWAIEARERWIQQGLFELWLNPDSDRWINRNGERVAS